MSWNHKSCTWIERNQDVSPTHECAHRFDVRTSSCISHIPKVSRLSGGYDENFTTSECIATTESSVRTLSQDCGTQLGSTSHMTFPQLSRAGWYKSVGGGRGSIVRKAVENCEADYGRNVGWRRAREILTWCGRERVDMFGCLCVCISQKIEFS